MKLQELAKHKRKNRSGKDSQVVNIESYNYGDLKLKVSFEFDDGDIDVQSIKLAAAVEQDGKKFPIGTSAADLPEWDKVDDKSVDKALNRALKARSEDD